MRIRSALAATALAATAVLGGAGLATADDDPPAQTSHSTFLPDEGGQPLSNYLEDTQQLGGSGTPNS